MPLTPEQRKHVDDWLKHTCNGPRPCPVCGKDFWEINEDLLALPVFRHRKPVLDPSVPYVSLDCKHCGYGMFFSAMIIGLMPGQ
jgi:predicted nucleic-acid-binding Zn-ribbon protein